MLQVYIGAKNVAAESVKQELVFVGSEAGKLIAIRDIIRKVGAVSAVLSRGVFLLPWQWRMQRGSSGIDFGEHREDLGWAAGSLAIAYEQTWMNKRLSHCQLLMNYCHQMMTCFIAHIADKIWLIALTQNIYIFYFISYVFHIVITLP